MIQLTWNNNGKRLIRTARVKCYSSSSLTGPLIKSSTWTMMTTRMISRPHRRNKVLLNKLTSRVLIEIKAKVRANLQNQKFHHPQTKVKKTSGKPLRKSFPGATQPNTRQNETNIGLALT